MSIKDRSKRVIVAGAAAVGLTLGVATLAGAATTPDQAAPQGAERDQQQEPTLNGSVQAPDDESLSEAEEAKSLEGMAKVSAADAEEAALTAVPGGTVTGSELENENGSVVYEVEVTDPAGQAIEVKVDAGNAQVLAQETEEGDEAEGSESEEDEGPESEEGDEAEGDEGSESEEDEANEGPEGDEAAEVTPAG